MSIFTYFKYLKQGRKPYSFQARYVKIESSNKHCYIHPQNEATHWELNIFDKSYRKPVCNGCVGI